MMTQDALITIERHQEVAWLTLNAPERLNVLSPAMLEQLARSLAQIRDDPRARAVVLIGAGERAFSAGADIRYLHGAAPLAVRAYARLAVAVTQQIEGLGKPTIAALNGLALGGGLELAEACMRRGLMGLSLAAFRVAPLVGESVVTRRAELYLRL